MSIDPKKQIFGRKSKSYFAFLNLCIENIEKTRYSMKPHYKLKHMYACPPSV